jgi:alpha-D-ribose 1-methylphosphonate 5-triphosphate diphosphatase
MHVSIAGGRALVDGAFVDADITVADGLIAGFGVGAGEVIDACGALVLPGIVDIHGDAFERHVMPRPGVFFPLAMALADVDRHLVSCGVTTAFHGLTWSWEPGLRGADAARAFIAALADLRASLICDTRLHLRHETYNLDAEAEILDLIAAGRIDLLAFNDHMDDTLRTLSSRRDKLAKMVERSGLDMDGFVALARQVAERADEVTPHLERLAAAARAAGVTLMSHDDRHVEDRRAFRAMGCTIAEFPKTEEAAADAVAHGEPTVFGAPNVVRGGSHTGCASAAEMVAKGLCTVLASDYYYPALFAAPFLLAERGAATLERAWDLVSANPAAAAGLADRGRIAAGLRADLLVVAMESGAPRIRATIAAGRPTRFA